MLLSRSAKLQPDDSGKVFSCYEPSANTPVHAVISHAAAPLAPVDTSVAESPSLWVAAVLMSVLLAVPSMTTDPQLPAMPSEALGTMVPRFDAVADVNTTVTWQPALAVVTSGRVMLLLAVASVITAPQSVAKAKV
jgi:hypothetical protein